MLNGGRATDSNGAVSPLNTEGYAQANSNWAAAAGGQLCRREYPGRRFSALSRRNEVPSETVPCSQCLAILMFLFLAIPVVAQNENAAKDLSDSGRVFFSTCAVVDKPVSTLTVSEAIPYVHCVSYVGAIFDTMALYDSIGIGPHVFCAPEQDRVQRDTLVRSVRKYIAAHPELSNEQTVYLVRLALLDEFSCRSAKR